MRRWFAKVDAGRNPHSVGHHVGLPPQLSGGTDLRVRLPDAAAVVLEEEDGGNCYVFRFDSTGTELNDTWHESREDANAQIAFEFGDTLGEWSSVPDGLADLAGFVRSHLARVRRGSDA